MAIRLIFITSIFISFSCVKVPNLELSLRDSPEVVESAMLTVLPLLDSIFPLSLGNGKESVFLGFHLTDSGEVILGDSLQMGMYENKGLENILDYSNLSPKGKQLFAENFNLLVNNSIRGVLLGIEPQFDYIPGGKYDREKFYFTIILNRTNDSRVREGELARNGNLILIYRSRHIILN